MIGTKPNSTQMNNMNGNSSQQSGFQHQPKVLGRQNLDFLSSFNNNNTNNVNIIANNNNFKRETPKSNIGGNRLMQDFQSLFFNSPSNTQRSNNHILSHTLGGAETTKSQQQQQQQQQQQMQPQIQFQSPQNILKSTNQKMIFPVTMTSATSKISKAKLNNFLNEDNESSNNTNNVEQTNGVIQGNTLKSNQKDLVQGNIQTLATLVSSLKKLTKEDSIKAMQQQLLQLQAQQTQIQNQSSQKQLTNNIVSNTQNSTNLTSSQSIFHSKENANSYAYQHQQQLQLQSTKNQTTQPQQQFYRPPSSDRNLRNSTLKAMSTVQLNNQIRKKDTQNFLRNSFDPVTKTSRSNNNSPQNGNFINIQPNTYDNNNNNGNERQPPIKPSINSYVSNLNRGDDLISNALQNATSSTQRVNQKLNSETPSNQIQSNSLQRKDSKPSNQSQNSLRNSSVTNAEQSQLQQQQTQIRSSSASKDYKPITSTTQGQKQFQVPPKQINLALPHNNNTWMSSVTKPSTTKEQSRPKNFLFFENSENIASNSQAQTTKGSGNSQIKLNGQSANSNNKNNSEQEASSQSSNNNPLNNSLINLKNIQPFSRQNSNFHEYYMLGIEKSYQLPLQQDYFSQIHREHFLQTFQGIQYAQIAKPANPHDLQAKKVFLKGKAQNKKTLIFDLDETLIHCNENSEIPSDVVLSIRFPQGEVLEAGINVRPFAVELLKELSNYFEIVVFTASHSSYAKAVLDYLDPHKKYIHHRFFRDQCIMTPQGVYIKDLRIFADRNLSEMVLVDNAAYSFAFQIENGIPIIPFYENKKDEVLKDLLPYLLSLKDVKDVREVNKNTFKFYIYQQCDSAQKAYERLFQTPPSVAKANTKPIMNNFLQNNKGVAIKQTGFTSKAGGK